MDEFVEKLSRDTCRRIVHVRLERPSLPQLGPSVESIGLPEQLVRALKARGIDRLYKFQVEAIEHIRAGRSVSIVAGTGTGKTEAFLLPILEDVVRDPYIAKVRAIVIYPTKALARDQLERIDYYMAYAFGARAAVLDGDTPEKERRRIYSYPPQVLITNPDMIHMALQYSRDFRRLISDASYVILDDAHVYSGVFGAHVAYVIRRLKRFLREEAVFVTASATIGNPKEFAETLFGTSVEVVSAGPTRRGTVLHVLVKPVGRSKLQEALNLLRACIEEGLKTLIFVDSHRLAELLKMAADRLGLNVGLHRAGLKPEERKRVEHGIKTGSLDAVIATPTLELGIDIGTLDAVIMYSIPPTYSKYVQRTGRVGRRGQKAYVFTILGDDPISAYYERNPDDFFDRKFERAIIDTENEEIAKVHLLAMTRDSPYKLDELSGFEQRVVRWLLSKGLLRIRGNSVRLTREGARYLSERQSLRGVGEVVKIVTKSGKTIGYREMPMALKELHPGAIYLHGGRLFLSLSLERRRAIVEPLPQGFNYLTKPLYYSEPEVVQVTSERTWRAFALSYVSLMIKDVVYGYVVRRYPGMEFVRENILDKEYTYSFKTKGVLVWLPPYSQWDEWENAEALHAIEHALISAAEIAVGASPTDLGGISFPSGHIYIYDSFPGGSGISKEVFKRFEEVAVRALDIVTKCSCEDGCPRCIYSPYCGNNNKILSRKKAALLLTQRIKGELKVVPTISRYGKPIV